MLFDCHFFFLSLGILRLPLLLCIAYRYLQPKTVSNRVNQISFIYVNSFIRCVNFVTESAWLESFTRVFFSSIDLDELGKLDLTHFSLQVHVPQKLRYPKNHKVS